MYDRDMPRLRAHGLGSPEGFADVVTFVLLTIQQPLQTVAASFADVKATGAASRFLFGAKRDGFAYLQANKRKLFKTVVARIEAGDCEGAVEALTAVPSLGMVKAAFVAQILGCEVACIDMHNLARLGLKETAVKLPKTVKPETRRAKIAAYVKLTRDTGGARFWWDSWCEYVAGRRGSPLKTADAVSFEHVRALSLS